MAAEIIDGKAFAARLRERVGAETARSRRSTGWCRGSRWCWSATIRRARSTCATRGGRPARRGCIPRSTGCGARPARPSPGAGRAAEPRPARSTASSCSCRCRRMIDEARVISAVAPEKDVDGFHVANVGRLATGLPAMVPCTPLGCLMLLRDRLGRPRRARGGGDRAVEHRRQADGAAPPARELHGDRRAFAHPRPRRRSAPRADILVAAVGRPGLVTARLGSSPGRR